MLGVSFSAPVTPPAGDPASGGSKGKPVAPEAVVVRPLRSSSIETREAALISGVSGGAVAPAPTPLKAAGVSGFRGVRGFDAQDYFEHYTRRDPGTGCLEWTGVLNNGKPQARLQGRRVSARVLAWELFHPGAPRPARLDMGCGNPLCVEPSHTFHVLYRSGPEGLARLVEWGTCRQGEHLIWTRAAEDDHSPDMWLSDRKVPVRRLTWEQQYGCLPEGVWLACGCSCGRCVDPDHSVVIRGTGTAAPSPRTPAARNLQHNARIIAAHVADFPGQTLHQISRYCGVPKPMAAAPLIEAVLQGWVNGRRGLDAPIYFPIE